MSMFDEQQRGLHAASDVCYYSRTVDPILLKRALYVMDKTDRLRMI